MINDDFAAGKKGEEKLEEWFNNIGIAYNDVRDDRAYQARDIDYILPVSQYNDDMQQLYYNNIGIDAKYDKNYNTGNYFLEIISNDTKGTIGWALASQADFITIYFPTDKNKNEDTGELHIIDMRKLRPYLLANWSKYRQAKAYTYDKYGNLRYSTTGILINRQALQLIMDIDVYTI